MAFPHPITVLVCYYWLHQLNQEQVSKQEKVWFQSVGRRFPCLIYLRPCETVSNWKCRIEENVLTCKQPHLYLKSNAGFYLNKFLFWLKLCSLGHNSCSFTGLAPLCNIWWQTVFLCKPCWYHAFIFNPCKPYYVTDNFLSFFTSFTDEPLLFVW